MTFQLRMARKNGGEATKDFTAIPDDAATDAFARELGWTSADVYPDFEVSERGEGIMWGGGVQSERLPGPDAPLVRVVVTDGENIQDMYEVEATAEGRALAREWLRETLADADYRPTAARVYAIPVGEYETPDNWSWTDVTVKIEVTAEGLDEALPE